MSTRSNIIIQKTTKYEGDNVNNGLHKMQFYRHYDGYITGTGLDLVELMIKFINENEPKDIKTLYDVEIWLKSNFTMQFEREHELGLHGDIEFLYIIDLDDGVSIEVKKRGLRDSVDDVDAWPSEIIFKAKIVEYLNDTYYQLRTINIKD